MESSPFVIYFVLPQIKINFPAMHRAFNPLHRSVKPAKMGLYTYWLRDHLPGLLEKQEAEQKLLYSTYAELKKTIAPYIQVRTEIGTKEKVGNGL